MYVGLLHFFLFISIVCAVNVGKLHLQPATTFIPAFFYSSILWPVILAQREVKQKRQQNVLRQSPSRSSFGAVLKVMLGFSKECQNVPYFCRLVTWRLRQCLDILFKGVSTVSEAPSFDTTCYTAWNIQLTRGAGLGLASEHLDLLLSEDVKIGRDRKLSETDRVCEYDDMIYIYIYLYTYINIYTICIWYVYVSCLGSFGWIKFNEGTLHGSKSSLPGPWPHVTALHVGSEPAAFLWDYSLGLWIFECHWTCCEIWKKVLWYILIYQSIMNSIMNFSTKDLGAKWHLIFLAQHGESQCCWPNWRMGPSPCAPLQLPS